MTNATKNRAASALTDWAVALFIDEKSLIAAVIWRANCLAALLSCAMLQPAGAHTISTTTAATTTTSSWTCNAFYLPARSIWQRTVTIDFDGATARSVLIDGVAVYTFAVSGTSVMTAVDGERIQFDVAALTWTSDLRGLISATGRCAP